MGDVMILLDSGVVLAYTNTTEEHHKRAVEIFDRIDAGAYGTAVITDYVFDEAITLILSRTKNFKMALKTGEYLLEAVEMINTEMVFEDSWKIFKTQNSQRLSFTDCSIIAVCKANGIATIATFDRALKEESGLAVAD